MTVHDSDDALLPDHGLVAIAEYDEHTGEAYCGCCSGPLEGQQVFTPTLDATAFENYDIDLPVFGWRCRCRRSDVEIVAVIEAAPDSYEPITATVCGEIVDIAVPGPVLEGVSADV